MSVANTWERVGSASITVPDDACTKFNIFEQGTVFNVEDDEISSKSGFDDGSSWARTLKPLVKSGKVAVKLEEILLLGTPLFSQKVPDAEYRDFKGSNGKVIQAVLIDKTDTEATLLLCNGQRAVVAFDKLAPEELEYIKKWNKEEAVFKDRRILATDMLKDKPPGTKSREDGILGAEFMSKLDAVISYPDRRIRASPPSPSSPTSPWARPR